MPHQGRLTAPLGRHCRRQLHISLWSRFWGSKRPGNEQSSASKCIRLFIRDLKGKTFQFQWDLGWDLEHTYLAVAQRVGVPHGLFYMTWNCTMLTPKILLSLSVDDVVVMHGRIRGGGSDTTGCPVELGAFWPEKELNLA